MLLAEETKNVIADSTKRSKDVMVPGALISWRLQDGVAFPMGKSSVLVDCQKAQTCKGTRIATREALITLVSEM